MMEVDQSVVLLHVVVQSEQYVTEHGHREREREIHGNGCHSKIHHWLANF